MILRRARPYFGVGGAVPAVAARPRKSLRRPISLNRRKSARVQSPPATCEPR